MRLFVAVKLSPEAKQLIKDTQTIFRKLGVSGNYTSEENMHLTLAFIGEYDDPDKVMEALKEVSFEPFGITLGKTGRFGDLWWMGVYQSGELGLLAEKVRKALGDRGIPYDPKQFKAHITFLRRAVYKGTEPGEIPAEPVKMPVESFSLFRSERGRYGMIYTEIGKLR